MYKQYRPYRRFLVFMDLILTVLVFAVIVELRPDLPGRMVGAQDVVRQPVIYVAVLLLWHILFATSGVYDLSRLPYFSKQIGPFTSSFFLAVFIFAGLMYFSYRELSRMVVIYFAFTDYFVLLLFRYGLTVYLGMRNLGVGRTNVLIAGATEAGVQAAKIIKEQHGSIYNLVGFAHSDGGAHGDLPSALIGKLEDVPWLIREYNVELVLVMLPESGAQQMEKLIMDLYPLPVRIYLVPDLLKLTLLNSEVESFGDLMVIGIREPVIQGRRRVVKRAFDLIASSTLLTLFAPLFVAIAIAIRLDSKGPIIYRARRIGENGRIFEMLKFRSMVAGAEALQSQVQTLDEDGRPIYKVGGDPRVTRVGWFLRRTSLDELPQLINVFKGEMSLVGPRPEQPFITDHYEYWQWTRLAVPPGITGWWQVSGRSDLPMHLNTQYDLYYVRNYSFLLDIKILFKTIITVIKGTGAY